MLTPDESLILDLLLAGDDELLVALRAQLAHVTVIARTEDSRGIVLDFEVAEAAARVTPGHLDLTDVAFTVEGMPIEGFASAWVEDGMLDRLEMIALDAAWRPGMRIGEAWWTRLAESEGEEAPRFERVAERDIAAIRAEVARRLEPAVATDAEPEHELHSVRPADTIALPLLLPIESIALRLFPIPGAEDARGELNDASALAAVDLDRAYDVLADLPMLFEPELVAGWLGAPTADLPIASLVRYWKAWARAQRPEPVIAALSAALLAGTERRSILDRRAQPLARELYHYLRGQKITGWPEAAAHAEFWWKQLDSRERIWELIAESLLARMEELERIDDQIIATVAAHPPAAEDAPAVPAAKQTAQPDPAALLLEELHEKLAHARREAERERKEVEQLRLAKKELRARLTHVEAESAPLRAEVARLERNVRLFQFLLAEARAAAEAGDPDPIPDPPEAGWPADLLAGVSIALCTGQERGNARHAMADELRAVGADVRVYELNGPGVPDRFPSDTVVVCDVRFTGHAATDRVRVAAERGGSKLLELRAGQGGIVRAVIAAVGVG